MSQKELEGQTGCGHSRNKEEQTRLRDQDTGKSLGWDSETCKRANALFRVVTLKFEAVEITKRVSCYLPIIPTSGRKRQKDHEFEDSLNYTVRPWFKNRNKMEKKKEKKKKWKQVLVMSSGLRTFLCV